MASAFDNGSLTGKSLVAITPNDSGTIGPFRALRCRSDGVAGTVRFLDNAGGVCDTYITPGEVLWVVVTAVKVAGTTATKLEGYL